jgi:hypothetical protein
MKSLPPFRAACGAGLALGLSLSGVAAAQPSALPPPPTGSVPPAAIHPAPAAADDLIHGDFSLKQREDRLAALLNSSVADGSLSRAEYSRARGELAAIQAREDSIRQRHHGELTDTTTFRLEGRIKALIASLRWNP